MCGIAGLISRAPLSSSHVEKIHEVNHRLEHRGPDGEGTYASAHVMLAMRRLSIIDLKTGWQPLFNEDRSLVLIANGEIYNFVELRRDLQAQGHAFSTGSDCETILHLYEEYGLAFVDHLRGMYAFALWDDRARRLILGRDRMGEKPLYLVSVGESLYFASELRALIQSGVVPFELDAAAVHTYFHYGYVADPSCIVSGVRKLPAANILIINLDPWEIRERRYWRMEDAPALRGNPAQLIRDELERSAQLITRADVPVGVALSGGIDASAIAALASSERSCDLHAFTVGYTGTPWQDERADAERFAKYLKIPFHSVELSTTDFIEQYSSVNLYRDDPIADIAGVAIAAVAQLARHNSVPVLLFGHGGDELFWGYQWMRSALHSTRRREAVAAGLCGITDYMRVSAFPLSVTLGIQWAMSGAGILTEWRQYQADRRAARGRVVFYDSEPFFQFASRTLCQSLYTNRFINEIGQSDLTVGFTARGPDVPPEVTLIRLICETYLMENGIAQADRLSMSASVEARLPLVDYRLVETVIGLHKTYPFSSGAHPKQWFLEAVAGLVPDFVLKRRKRGFSPPWRQWGHALAVSHGDQLVDGYLVQNRIIRPEAAKQQRKDLIPRISGPRPMAQLTLALENWCRQMTAASDRRSSWAIFERGTSARLTSPISDLAMSAGAATSTPKCEPDDQWEPRVPDPNSEIGHKALRGSIWLIAATGAAKALGIACQLVLAWFLTKRDFGVYAIAVSLSVLLSVLRDGGLPMVLEHKARRFDLFAGPVFWMMLAINIATGALIAAIAHPAARFYHIPELTGVITLFAITVPMCVAPAVLNVRLAVNMQFRVLGLIQIASAVIRYSLMLFFAWSGYGARSFLLPLLITNVTDTAMLWMATRCSPWAMRPRLRLWPVLFRSGRWVLLGTFGIALGNNGAYFLLGKVLSSDALGTYFFAFQIVMQLGMLVADNVYQVLFAAFVRISKDLPRIVSAVPRALGVVVIVAATVSLLVAAIYEPLDYLLWRGKWSDATLAIYVLAMAWPAAAAGSVLRALQMATGRFHQWGLLSLGSAISSVGGATLGAYAGRSATAAAVGFALGSLLGGAVNAWFALTGIGISVAKGAVSVLRPWSIIVLAGVCARIAGHFVNDTLLKWVATILCFMTFGSSGLWLFAHNSVQLVLNSLRQIVRGKGVVQLTINGEPS